MPNKRKVQQLPSIMIEDFDSREVTFAYSSFPINLSPPATDECTTVIRPHVDAYVTPLSLCHASTPITPIAFPADKTLIVANGRVPSYLDYETSFTSIDIGGLNASKVTSDCSMNSSNSGRSDVGCFDIRSGLMRVTQSITTGIGTGFEHGRDLHLEMPTTPSKPRANKKKCNVRYAMGLFFILLAFAAVVAVCVTVYIEFVAKPSWSASTMNEVSSICDFIVNGCDYNNTSVMSHLVNHTVALNNSGRTAGELSDSFLGKTSYK